MKTSATTTVASKKRKRKNNIKVPNAIFHNESSEVVASIAGPVITAPLDPIDKEILLERFKIELLDRCNFFTRRPQAKDGDDVSTEEKRSVAINQCLIIGTNECTRALEKMTKKKCGKINFNPQCHFSPSLIMLARDLRPPTILAHIPILCKQIGIPIVLLPGKASSDVGKLLHRKRAAVLLLCTYDEYHLGECSDVERDVSNRISSFINFAISKIPTSFLKIHE